MAIKRPQILKVSKQCLFYYALYCKINNFDLGLFVLVPYITQQVFGLTGFVYDCSIWLCLFSCMCLNETASSLSAKSAPKENKMLEKNKMDSRTKPCMSIQFTNF